VVSVDWCLFKAAVVSRSSQPLLQGPNEIEEVFFLVSAVRHGYVRDIFTLAINI